MAVSLSCRAVSSVDTSRPVVCSSTQSDMQSICQHTVSDAFTSVTHLSVSTPQHTPSPSLQTVFLGGGMAEWLASPDCDREVVGSNPGVTRSDGQ